MMSKERLIEDKRVFDEQLRNPKFRQLWEKNAFARAISDLVIEYRADNNLSQRDLAKLLGVSQPSVVQIESGDHTPTIDTLAKLSNILGIEIAIDLAPAGKKPHLITSKAQKDKAVGSLHGSEVRIAAA